MLEAHKARLLCIIIRVISKQLYRLALTAVQFMPTFFFAKTLCVTRVMTCNCLRKNSTSGLAAHSSSDYRFLTFWSKPFIDIIFCIQLWIWKKVLTHLCSIALVFLLMFLRSHNIVKNALKGLLNLTGKRAQCRMWTGCSIGACN